MKVFFSVLGKSWQTFRDQTKTQTERRKRYKVVYAIPLEALPNTTVAS
jgi:hypothetical protein